ncbi:MAG: hypothetical protein CR972_02450 [Candidatus Moraniibacteriota bacterium]|nr:MAG: hypothetical protein CR972_02450 [Candidatus Moranbacteria bacterium]
MSLDKLKKDIQGQDSEVLDREHDKTVYNEWESKEVQKKESAWKRFMGGMQETRSRAIVVGGIVIGVIVFLLIASASFMYYQGGFFANDRVTFSMEAPQTAKSNDITEILFYYENDNRAKLMQSEIVVRFGEYFVPEENQENFTRVSASQGVITIDQIEGGKKGSVSLAGHFVGPKESSADISSTLRYVPEASSTRYIIDARSSTVITSSAITVDIESPQEVVSGNLLDVVVKVQNTSADRLDDIKMTIDVPKEFSVHSIEPRASHGFMWLIGEMAPHEEKIYHIRGGLDAAIGSVQIFDVEVGVGESGDGYMRYANAKYTPRIVSSPILVHQEIDTRTHGGGVAYAGESVRYSIKFTNDSDIALRDAIVTLNLEGEAIDFESLTLGKQGDYDQENRRIIWKAADVPALRILKPKDSGEVTFSFNIKEQLPVNTENDHHFSITSVAAIDSEDIPSQLRENKTVLSNVRTLPVGAKVIFSASSEYDSGQEQPKVGEKSVYKITMKIDSINNDISNAVVSIPLPTHTTFEGGDSKEISYKERTNDITWTVGDIAHGTGVTSDSKTVSFRVGIVPSVDQIDKSPVLLKKQFLSAVDLFTELEINGEAHEIYLNSDGRFGEVGLVQP